MTPRVPSRALAVRLRWLLAALGAALVAGAAPEAPATSPSAPGFEIRDWMAVGSGCRARLSAPGDVQVRLLADDQVRGKYLLQVYLPGYQLRGDQPAEPGAVDFARECAVRLAIYPAAGKRVKAIASGTTFSVEKDASAQVRLRTRLLVGNDTLSKKEDWIIDGRSSTRDLSLRPDDAAVKQQPAPCAEPELVGLDLSAALFRTRTGTTATVQLQQHLAALSLEVEDCVRPATQGARSP